MVINHLSSLPNPSLSSSQGKHSGYSVFVCVILLDALFFSYLVLSKIFFIVIG